MGKLEPQGSSVPADANRNTFAVHLLTYQDSPQPEILQMYRTPDQELDMWVITKKSGTMYMGKNKFTKDLAKAKKFEYAFDADVEIMFELGSNHNLSIKLIPGRLPELPEEA